MASVVKPAVDEPRIKEVPNGVLKKSARVRVVISRPTDIL